MKHLLSLALFSLPILASACSVGQLKMEHAYVRATPPDQTNTAAYLEIENRCDKAVELTSVTSPVAGRVELHEVIMVDGVAKMQKVDMLNLAPRAVTKLVPGGMHIMMMDLQRPVRKGSTIPLTFNFKDGSMKTLAVPVKDIRQDAEQHHH
jgi:copper(I)-binding protein